MKVLQNLLKKIRQFFVDMWTGTSSRDRLRYLVIAAIALVLIIGSMALLGSGRYVKLATDASPSELAAATQSLQEAGIAMKTADGGTTILVDNKDLNAGMAALARKEESASLISYETYLQATGIMSTADDKDFFKKQFLQERLTAILRDFDGVSNAHVLLNIQENKSSVLTSEIKESTASVSVRFTADASAAPAAVVESIALLVANAADIKPENVAVLDSATMKNLRQSEPDYTDLVEKNMEITRQYNSDVANSVKKLLIPALGEDYFTVLASATLSFDDIKQQNVEFRPVVDEDGIPRSFQLIEEEAKGGAGDPENPGVDPNGGGDVYTSVENQYSEYKQRTETVNYEINQYNTQIEKAKGEVTDLTISLVVDNERMEDTPQNRELLQSAVGNAVGLPQDEWATRVSVNFSEFKQRKEDLERWEQNDADIKRTELFSFLQVILLYVIIGACVILLGWRTLNLFKPKEVEVPEGSDFLVGDLAEYGEMVDAAVQSMELEVAKTASRERVEEFIESNPEAVALMLRNWLADEGKAW